MPMQLDQSQAQALQKKVRRQQDAIVMFRPLPHDEPRRSQEEFFRCLQPMQVLSCGANRSGKSTLAAVKIAAIALDRDITLRSGEKIPQRRPDQKGRALLIWLVGYDLKHVGQTLYGQLFRPGQFKAIRDKQTGLLRAFDPLDPDDAARAGETIPAPPLIPDWEIKEISWYNAAAHELKEIVLKNGTIIRAYSSTQEPKQGDKVDIIWVDERIENPRHWPEWLMRLVDLNGRIFWSVYPALAANDVLVNLYEAADRFLGDPDPPVVRFDFRQSDNPFLNQRARAQIKRSEMLDEEEMLTRDEGLLLVDQRRMYPLFSKRMHSLLPENPADDDAVAAAVRKLGDIPPEWTRYLALDPGSNHPAIVVVAVPPPKLGDFCIAYDEITNPRIDANVQASLAAKKWKGQRFQAFYIDDHAARQTAMTFGITVRANIERAFARYGMRSVETGSSFLPGSDSVLGRIGIVQGWMTARHNARPKLLVWLERCPKLTSQLLSYRKKMERDGTLGEDPAPKQVIDAAVCLEYVASMDPRYVASPTMPDFENLIEEFCARHRKRRPVVNCGPGQAVA